MATSIYSGSSSIESFEFVMEICCNCNLPFMMPKWFREHVVNDSRVNFYCPKGHSQHYTKTLREEMNDLIQTNKTKLESKNSEIASLKKEIEKYKTITKENGNDTLKNLVAFINNLFQLDISKRNNGVESGCARSIYFDYAVNSLGISGNEVAKAINCNIVTLDNGIKRLNARKSISTIYKNMIEKFYFNLAKNNAK